MNSKKRFLDENPKGWINKDEAQLERLAELIAVKIDSGRSPGLMVHTIDEAAALLKVKRSTIANLIHRTQELSACKVGRELRIRDEDLKRFLAGRARPCVDDTRRTS